MKIIFTRHANEKFVEEEYVRQLDITKDIIKTIIKNPDLEDRTRGEKITCIGNLDSEHVLVIIYREEEPDTKIIITFFPAKKGRYETKILQRR